MSDPLTLEEIRDSLRVGAPAVLATADHDGTPHISYVTQVCYLDAERVGISRQAFNRALSTLTDGRFSQLMIVSVLTGAQYRLDLRYLHTVTDGEAFDAMASNLVALAAGADADPAFRLTGVDVHRVLRVEADSAAFNGSGEPPQPPTDPLAAVEQLARRLERCVSYDETVQALCDVLEDAFAIPYAILFRLDAVTGQLHASATTRAARDQLGTSLHVGEGLVGTAARRRRVVATPNVARAHPAVREAAAVDGQPENRGAVAGLPGARNVAAIPLLVGDTLLGVLKLESAEPGAFTGRAEAVLGIIGAHAAAALAARAMPAAPEPRRTILIPGQRNEVAPLELVHYEVDNTILCGSAYVVKGAAGRILWAMLTARADTGRTEFTNRELRLDESLWLPSGNDNLESRLLALRRRLAEINCGITLERIGRGRHELGIDRPATLSTVTTADSARAGPGRGQ